MANWTTTSIPEQTGRTVLITGANSGLGLRSAHALASRGARVLLAGVSYKAGVRDLRESPALPIITGLVERGVEVAYHDPLIDEVQLSDGERLTSAPQPRGADWDLVVVHTVHPGFDYAWAADCARVLDATYQFDLAPHRQVV